MMSGNGNFFSNLQRSRFEIGYIMDDGLYFMIVENSRRLQSRVYGRDTTKSLSEVVI